MSCAQIKILPIHPEMGGRFPLPRQMSALAAGFDLVATLDAPIQLEPGECRPIPCGFAMELPPGFEAQVRSRSGLALRHRIVCINSPGTIDADYRGEVQVLLANQGKQAYTVSPGERTAQMVICRLPEVELQVVDRLSESQRGTQGFGSTGTKEAAHG
jgi:dUTP pyrophosphatase